MNKEFSGKKLLVLGGVKLACDIVEHAKQMGAYVVVADYNIDSPAKQVADEGVLIDAMDVDALVAYCVHNSIDGITTGFVDILMPVCYEVCKRLSLPYYATPKMLSMATNKMDFKETCKLYGVPIPKTYVLGNHIEDEVYQDIRYPVFVKPLDASGSRGAGVCYSREELDAQFAEALDFSSSKNAIVEEYLTGREFLLDYIAVDGEFRLLSMFDRYMCSDRGSAINYSNVSMAPSKAIHQYLDKINGKVIQMFKSLGFTDGLLFMQGYVNGDRITFYEMGSRLGGSFYDLEQACIGCNPVDMVIRYALSGRMVDDINIIDTNVADFKKTALVCNYLLKGDDETIDKIVGLEDIKKIPSVVEIKKHRDVGLHYRKDKTIDKPVVTIYLAANSLTTAKQDLEYINQKLKVENSKGQSLLMEKLDPAIL